MIFFKKRFALMLMMAISFSICIKTATSAVLPLPTNVLEGINYVDDTTVVLVLLAPGKEKTEVTGTFNNWTLTAMNKTPDGERFWIQLNGLNPGEEYIYQYLVDDNIRIADPFAEKILDPWNDQLIPESVYPNLIVWDEVDKGLASVFQTAQTEYQWQVTDFEAPLKHHLVIYELLIRDFTAQHSFQSVIDSIQYLKTLGINAIELLPVNEFDGNISWGYNPAFYLAVDKYYGSKDKLKELIDIAHQNGIAVILDMVYNHSMNSHPLVSLYWDEENSQPAENNPWYNTTAPHSCIGWGNDFNHESEYTRNFFDRVNKHWLEEYNIDGYRYDFTKGFTQKQTAPRWEDDGDCGTSDYDGSRVANIKRMADKVWETKEDAYIILEHWGTSEEEDELTTYGSGMLTWKRVDHQYKEVIAGNKLDEETFYGSQVDTRVSFMESHDENRIMVNNHDQGNISWDGTYSIQNTETGLERVAAGAAFLYTVPGPKMIWMFGEQGYDFDINYCTDGTVTEECRTGPKPTVWAEYMQDANRADLYKTISELIKLRTENEAFTQGYFTMVGEGAVRQIKITHESMDVLIIGNFDVYPQVVTDPMFSKEGTWYNYFSGQDYDYTIGNQYFLAPGQWELFTSVPVDPDNILKPTDLSVTAVSSSVNLTWVDNANNETGYELQRSRTEDSGFATIANLGADAISFTDESLADGVYYYQVRATGVDNKVSDFSNTANISIGEIEGLTVYMKNVSNWSSVNVHYWNALPDVLPASNWPGPNMNDEGDGWFSYTFEGVTSTNLLFSNDGSSKTGDLSRDKIGWYDDGTWYDVDPRIPVDNPPTVSIAPAGGDFSLGESVTITISATDDNDTPSVYYTTDGSTPSSGSILYTASFDISANATIKAIAYDSENQASTVASNDYTFTEPGQGLTVYMNNTANWSSVNVHYWNALPDVLPASSWPGPIMTDEGDGWFSYTFEGVTSTNLLFSNNSADKTGDFSRDKDGWYENGTWSDVDPRGPKVPLLSVDNVGTSFTTSMSVNLSATEGGVIYYTIDGTTPSESSTTYSGSLTFTETTTLQSLAFNSVGSSNLISETYTKQTEPTGLTLHFKKPSNWSTVTMHFWNTTGAILTTGWPGVTMTDTDGDGWYDYTLPGVSCANVIFSNSGSSQTGDLTGICQESWYDNGWVNSTQKSASTVVDFSQISTKPYPNPFMNEINISVQETNTIINIEVMDLKGQVQYTTRINSGDGLVKLQPELKAGVYLLRVLNTRGLNTYKIVKQ